MKTRLAARLTKGMLIRYGVALLAVILVALGVYAVFQQQREIQQLQASVAIAGTGYATIAAEWTSVVPVVGCNFENSNNDTQGSGTLLQASNGNFYVLTNAHIVLAGSQTALNCDVGFLDNLVVYVVGSNDITTDTGSTDAALLQIPQDSFLTHLISTDTRKVCSSPPAIGDEMLMLGYPVAGSDADITVTEGIISGDDGESYVTSAKIDEGNSGGATIDVPNNCYFGIPSQIVPGEYTNMGRILKWETISADAPVQLSNARL